MLELIQHFIEQKDIWSKAEQSAHSVNKSAYTNYAKGRKLAYNDIIVDLIDYCIKNKIELPIPIPKKQAV